MRIVIVGTGTDVGKTHVSACLLAYARSRGLRVAAYKPVATGVTSRCDDCLVHAAALGAAYVAPSYAYVRPVSPHLAAREEGRPIDLSVIVERAAEMTPDAGSLVVETAGGLHSPLGDAQTNADLVERLLPAYVVLVAPDRIGVLHDVRACTLAGQACGLRLSAVVLCAPPAPDVSSGSNGRELEVLGLGPVAASFPRARFDAPESLASAERVWEGLLRYAPVEEARRPRRC